MKRKRYIAVIILPSALLATSMLLFYAAVCPKIPKGLSAEDYAVIKGIVSERLGDDRSPLFPDISWSSVRHFPDALRERLAGGVLSIDVDEDLFSVDQEENLVRQTAVQLRVSGPKGRMSNRLLVL